MQNDTSPGNDGLTKVIEIAKIKKSGRFFSCNGYWKRSQLYNFDSRKICLW